MNNPTPKKTAKPCPRCGSAAGAGNGGSQCQCKKGKQSQAGKPAPCDAPIGNKDKTAQKGDCGCQKK